MGEGGREGGEGRGQLLVVVREVFANISAYSSCINEEKVTFAPMITGAFSYIVGKLFSELKLVTDNLLFIYAEATERKSVV